MLHPPGTTGCQDVCERLMVAGADVNVQDGGGGSPLLHATDSAQHALITALVARKVSCPTPLTPTAGVWLGSAWKDTSTGGSAPLHQNFPWLSA